MFTAQKPAVFPLPFCPSQTALPDFPVPLRLPQSLLVLPLISQTVSHLSVLCAFLSLP